MRRVARESVLKLLFEYSFLEEYNETTKELFLLDTSLTDDDRDYINETYKGVIDSIDSLKETISKYITGYTIERLYRSDLVVLEIALYELKQNKEPVAVIINEAVSLAKKFGTEKSGAFVNGVLGNIAKELK